MSNHVNNVLEVAGPESDVRRLIVSIAKEGGSRRPYDFNPFVPATTQESKKRWLTDDATIEDPDKRPLVISFESSCAPPDALLTKLSLLFPTLVFGLCFVECWHNYLGWYVFHNGELYDSWLNENVYLYSEVSSDESCDGESLNPDGAMIDGYDAVGWKERFCEARNILPTRECAEAAGVSDQLAECEEMAPRVMDSAFEYMDAPIPHDALPISLDDFCEQVSYCVSAVKYRLCIAEVLNSVASAGAVQDASGTITDSDPETLTSVRGQPMQRANEQESPEATEGTS